MNLASRQSLSKTKHSFFSGVTFHNELAQEWVKKGRDISSSGNLIRISETNETTPAMKKVGPSDQLAANLVLEGRLVEARQNTA